MLGRYPVKMLSSLGITHHVSPTSSLFFGGKKALNWLAEKEEEGTAGLFHERRPLRELWDTCKRRRQNSREQINLRLVLSSNQKMCFLNKCVLQFKQSKMRVYAGILKLNVIPFKMFLRPFLNILRPHHHLHF